jgi:hypothetical protein
MPWDKLLIAAAAGGGVLFVWNAIVWMVISWHNADFRKLNDPNGVADALAKAGVTPGLYSLPHWHEFEGGMKDPKLQERFQKGPNAMICVGPNVCMQGSAFLYGFLLNFAQALAAAVIFHFAKPHLMDRLPHTLALFAAIGAFAQGGSIAMSVWMWYPRAWAIKTAIDGAVGFALMSLVLRLLL